MQHEFLKSKLLRGSVQVLLSLCPDFIHEYRFKSVHCTMYIEKSSRGNLVCIPQPIEHPVRTNQIPRQIPDQTFYTKPIPGIVMGGILPFGCIFIQLFFILNSIWYATYMIKFRSLFFCGFLKII